MNYDFVTNVPGCWDSVLNMMSGNVDLIYYSHAITAVSAILIGFLVIFQSRALINKVLFSLCLTFCLWILINFISWLSCNSIYVTTAWSFFLILSSFISFFSFYFFYIFIYKKDLLLKNKILLSLPILPTFYFMLFFKYINNFDSVNSAVVENGNATSYYYLLGFLTIIGIISLYFFSYNKIKKEEKKSVLLVVVGLEAFLLLFYSLGFLSDHFNNYGIEFYGLFGMPIFMAILAYVIVKFKAFDIKLVGAQALVWALVIVIGAEFLFVTNLTSQILVGVTLIISAILGLLLVRSVKKEVALREELEIANNNQQSLIHFITHQVKGFFTKSKMIFAGILEGDFGETSAGVKEVVQTGLNSDNNAVTMVQNILSASNFKSGTVAYVLAELDLAGLARDITKDFTEIAKNKNLTYNVNIPAEQILVMADKTQISQAVKNLIDNSVKYTPAGQINVSLKKVRTGDKAQALFEVSDTGVGLSDADKQKLFTEGGKGGEATKTNIESTGYGLYILKKIVENHGGKVWAESAGRGKGSQFYISLPTKQ